MTDTDTHFGDTVKFYRPKTVAMTVQQVGVRNREDVQTVNVEMTEFDASAVNGVGAFNWDNKTIVQVSIMELPDFIATLLKLTPKFQGRFHGEAHNKSVEMEWQSSLKLRVALSRPQKRLYMDLSVAEVFYLTQFMLRLLNRSPSGLASGSDALQVLKCLYATNA
jgi:hypothetical protein